MNKKQSLYTKYRPMNFDQVIGQDIAKDILINSILKNKINHAYLFYGIRGTGKTTLARIFAKAVNCKNLSNNFNPCNECSSCKEINNGSSFDVIEIDAASNNGVDEIRSIKENTTYLTTNSFYKVYIIDEVHMLTKAAFNALLKTLEEPPRNTIFLLATTELQKIPETVLSRTIIVNLESISNLDIIKGLENILKGENIDYNKESLSYLAKISGGSLRDAISYLETILLFNDNVNNETILKSLGLIDKNEILSLLNTDVNSLINKIDNIKGDINNLIYILIDVLFELINKGEKRFIDLLNNIIMISNNIKDKTLLKSSLKSALYNVPLQKDNVSRETIIKEIPSNIVSNEKEETTEQSLTLNKKVDIKEPETQETKINDTIESITVESHTTENKEIETTKEETINEEVNVSRETTLEVTKEEQEDIIEDTTEDTLEKIIDETLNEDFNVSRETNIRTKENDINPSPKSFVKDEINDDIDELTFADDLDINNVARNTTSAEISMESQNNKNVDNSANTLNNNINNEIKNNKDNTINHHLLNNLTDNNITQEKQDTDTFIQNIVDKNVDNSRKFEKTSESVYDVITDHINVHNYMYVIINNDFSELEKLKRKWKHLDSYITVNEYKDIISFLLKTTILATKDKSIILGFPSHQQLNEFKRNSLSKKIFDFIHDILGIYKFIFPISEDNWNKLILIKKTGYKPNSRTKATDLQFEDYIRNSESDKIDDLIDIFGKDNVKLD